MVPYRKFSRLLSWKGCAICGTGGGVEILLVSDVMNRRDPATYFMEDLDMTPKEGKRKSHRNTGHAVNVNLKHAVHSQNV